MVSMKKMIFGLLVLLSYGFVTGFAASPSATGVGDTNTLNNDEPYFGKRSPRKAAVEIPQLSPEDRAQIDAEWQKMAALGARDSEDWLCDAGLLATDAAEEPFVWTWQNIKGYLMSFVTSTDE
ncbi:hypothetical protein FJ365_01135 [Candidatus Dependentiae bacterium]|nr:hypothetical protein [Candidatus Dependentiae bacterium]